MSKPKQKTEAPSELFMPQQRDVKLFESTTRMWSVVASARDLTMDAIMSPAFLCRRIEAAGQGFGAGVGGVNPGDLLICHDTDLRSVWGMFLITSVNYAGRTAQPLG
ncbi:MAG TPA: hypothetical protein VH519_08440 [Hyphomicrobiaceae bacterium]|jgi:hypothetical protein